MVSSYAWVYRHHLHIPVDITQLKLPYSLASILIRSFYAVMVVSCWSFVACLFVSQIFSYMGFKDITAILLIVLLQVVIEDEVLYALLFLPLCLLLVLHGDGEGRI